MAVKILYFDESGQTGTKLLDADQPIFSVGSTDVSTDEAKAVIAEFFPRHADSEVKFRGLFRRPRNRPALIDFARYVGANSERFFCYMLDKRYAILARLVDWLVEPVVSARGFDWYQGDYGRRWVNMLYVGLSTFGHGLLTEVIALYDQFTTELSEAALARMQARYRQIARKGPKELRPFMGLLATGAEAFQQHYSLTGFTDVNDVHVACIVTSVGWWRSRHEEDFAIIHDQSTHFFKRQGLWDRVSSMEASSGVIHVGAKSLRFPLRVISTREADSKICPAIQLCDLVAGFVAKAKSPRLEGDEKAAIDHLIEAGMGELNFDSLSPGHEFVDGPPAEADGPDVVDQILDLISPQ